jgi:hypothetical protein
MLRLVRSTGFTDITLKTEVKDDGCTADRNIKKRNHGAYRGRKNSAVFLYQ